MRRKAAVTEERGQSQAVPSPFGRGGRGEDNGPSPSPRCNQTRAMLIKRMYEIDPLACPRCGGQMKVVAFIEPPQGALIEKILRHCGLWQPSAPRGPPVDIRSPASGSGAGGEGRNAASVPCGSMDWSDADGFYYPAEDFAQVAPDDSAYVDIDTCETTF
jgi:hypothetical protein